MHSVLIIAGGFALLGAMLLIAPFLGSDRRTAIATACRIFIPLWAVAAAANMAIGVLQAGYTVWQEAPFFVLVFGLPAVSAYLVSRRYTRR